MTSKEAINLFKQYHWKVEDKNKAIEILEKLVERDTPKKVIVNVDLEGNTRYNCPNCICSLNIPLREINGCPKCLQRLDWSK